jgi:hypothetical protein
VIPVIVGFGETCAANAPDNVSAAESIGASPGRVRRIMFDALQDPTWMAAVKHVEPLTEELRTGARVRRTGRFLGRTLRWTTEVICVSAEELALEIVDGPMRGTITYRIEPHEGGLQVTIRNIGHAPGFAPRWLLAMSIRRSLSAIERERLGLRVSREMRATATRDARSKRSDI